jgi:3-isopropylmalate/(R)-2-methylmalate dehydratase small subunit
MNRSPEEQLRQITGTAIALDRNDIDTDRIIPARFLKFLTFDALGEHVFEDDRKGLAVSESTHPFDEPERSGATVLVVAKNFGCGSSREHAPQALHRWGIRVVAGESFGEIFHGNSATIGLPCVTLSAADAAEAREMVLADPGLTVSVDLEQKEMRAGDRVWGFSINESLRERFVKGTWDTLNELSSARGRIDEVARQLPYLNDWRRHTALADPVDASR